MVETDRGGLRRLGPEYVAEHLEHAYALTGHGMQGGTVERAFVVAAPHELTKGCSYTALSRACGATRLFVISDSQARDRDELAPGERRYGLTDRELYARLRRYMQTRDDEDLAIEQLRSPATPVGAPRHDLANAGDALGPEDAAAERSGHRALVGASIETLRAADEQIAALKARLNALASPEVRRLEAAERRERELADHREELLDRLRQIPQPRKLPFASDRRRPERQNLQRALDAVDTEMTAGRTLRTRLVREIGEPDEIRLERAAIEGPLARALSERDRLRDELVTDELASLPRWAVAALGERPTDPPGAERYEQAQVRLDRVRHEIGLDVLTRKHRPPSGACRQSTGGCSARIGRQGSSRNTLFTRSRRATKQLAPRSSRRKQRLSDGGIATSDSSSDTTPHSNGSTPSATSPMPAGSSWNSSGCARPDVARTNGSNITPTTWSCNSRPRPSSSAGRNSRSPTKSNGPLCGRQNTSAM
jgi:hypothetical protein